MNRGVVLFDDEALLAFVLQKRKQIFLQSMAVVLGLLFPFEKNQITLAIIATTAPHHYTAAANVSLTVSSPVILQYMEPVHGPAVQTI